MPGATAGSEWQVAAMAALSDERSAGLWRYTMGLTSAQRRAEDVVREPRQRRRQQSRAAAAERSARGPLFTMARSVLVDERGSNSSTPRVTTPDEIGAALGQLVILDAIGQPWAGHRAVIELLVPSGIDYHTDCFRRSNRRNDGEVTIRVIPPGHCGSPCTRPGDTSSTRPLIRRPVGGECQMAQVGWLEPKAVRQPVHAPEISNAVLPAGDGR